MPRAPHATQRYDDVVISGLGHLDAPHVVTSAEMEQQLARTLDRLEVRRGLLEELSGIRERRVWDPGTLPSAKAAEAGELALERSGVPKSEIGMLINTSVSRDYIEPSTASIVHGRLGLPADAGNFDVGSACLGFVNGMNLVAAMIERGEIDHGLVVNAESSRFAVEATIARLAADTCDEAMFREQFATLTVGSGAVAMVLSRAGAASDSPYGEHQFLGGLSRSGTEHALLCTGQVDEMRTDTRGLLIAGVEMAALTWKEAVDTFGWNPEAIDVFAIHQVSAVHTRAVCDTLGLDTAKFPLIFPTHGNIGPASVPTVLSKSVDDGTITAGSRVMLMASGSGINAAAAEIVW